MYDKTVLYANLTLNNDLHPNTCLLRFFKLCFQGPLPEFPGVGVEWDKGEGKRGDQVSFVPNFINEFIQIKCFTKQKHLKHLYYVLRTYSCFCNFFFFFYFIFLAVLGLRCCTRAFSSCASRGYSSLQCAGFSLRWLLVSEHRL